MISEDCLIFYGFSPEITKLRQVYSPISAFMHDKQNIDPASRFNLIVFLKDGPNYFDQFTFDSNYILETLKSISNDISKPNIISGILISISLIIENFKKISEKLFRLLILIDQEFSEIPTRFLPILEDLINKVKNLPFYIDIICIENNNHEKNRTLEKLANLANGDLYQVNEIRDLSPLLNELSKKQFMAESLYSRHKLKMGKAETQSFYLALADEPINSSKSSTCSICFQKDIEGIVECPSCGTLAHKICWAQWAKSSDIQIPHLFRCHNCFNLLQLDKNFVFEVQMGIIPPVAKINKIEKKNIHEYLRDLESKNKPKIVKVEDPMVSEVRTIVESKKGKLQKEKEDISIIVNICPICNNIIIGNEKNCPICDFALFSD